MFGWMFDAARDETTDALVRIIERGTLGNDYQFNPHLSSSATFHYEGHRVGVRWYCNPTHIINVTFDGEPAPVHGNTIARAAMARAAVILKRRADDIVKASPELQR